MGSFYRGIYINNKPDLDPACNAAIRLHHDLFGRVNAFIFGSYCFQEELNYLGH